MAVLCMTNTFFKTKHGRASRDRFIFYKILLRFQIFTCRQGVTYNLFTGVPGNFPGKGILYTGKYLK